MRKILALVMVCALFCTVFCVGASAATIGSSHTSFTSASSTNYYVYYGSGSAKYDYYVGTTVTSGKLVKLAQVRLVWGSWYSGSNTYAQRVDGAYGDNTAQAIKNYQDAFGLSADGVIGAATWTAMLYYTYLDYPTSFVNLLETNAYL